MLRVQKTKKLLMGGILMLGQPTPVLGNPVRVEKKIFFM